jgi:hypothetical protein
VSIVDEAGNPVADAQVLLTGQGLPLHRVAASDERGSAAFSDLPAGRYVVAAEKRGFIKTAFGQQGGIDATVIALDADQSFAARMTLVRTGSVTGSITNEQGAPAQALVSLHQLGRDQGRRTLKLVVASRSDATGAYRFDDVAPGEYLVSAGADTVPVFYPGVSEPALAAPVRVVAGNSTPGVSITISSAPLGRFEGLVLNADGQPAGGKAVHISRTDELDPGGTIVHSNDSGEFRASVTPGTYRITSESGAHAEATAVSGVSSPITLRDGRAAAVSGRVEYAGDRSTARVVAGGVVGQIRAAGRSFPDVPLVVDKNDGTLRTFRLPAGDYRLHPSPTLSNWTLESITVNGRPIIDNGFLVESDGPMAIVLTLASGSTHLSGTVFDSRQTPIYSHQLLLFPAEPQHWVADSPRVRWLQPDTKGRFVVQGVPPGEYLLAAIEGQTGGWDPALLQTAASAAVRVRLERGTPVVQNVMIGK